MVIKISLQLFSWSACLKFVVIYSWYSLFTKPHEFMWDPLLSNNNLAVTPNCLWQLTHMSINWPCLSIWCKKVTRNCLTILSKPHFTVNHSLVPLATDAIGVYKQPVGGKHTCLTKVSSKKNTEAKILEKFLIKNEI